MVVRFPARNGQVTALHLPLYPPGPPTTAWFANEVKFRQG